MLRRASDPVTAFDGLLRRLARDMIDTMRASRGIGLAAQQVGETVSLCVLEIPAEPDAAPGGPEMPMVLVNPRITAAGQDKESFEEGCLSFPDLAAPVVRPADVEVAYQDLDGAEHRVSLQGLAARAVQHEIDHLQGILLVDRMTQMKKLALSGRLKRLRRETRDRLARAEPGGAG